MLPYQTCAPKNGGWYEMLAILFFCVLPIVLLFIAAIGAAIIQIGFNSIEDDKIQKDFEDYD